MGSAVNVTAPEANENELNAAFRTQDVNDPGGQVTQKNRQMEAFLKCGSILKRANEYLEKTAGYGITADELKNLAAELSGLEIMQPSIGIITNERKSAVRSVKTLIREGSFILDKMDDGLEGIVDDNIFPEGWFAIRRIKGTPVKCKNQMGYRL